MPNSIEEVADLLPLDRELKGRVNRGLLSDGAVADLLPLDRELKAHCSPDARP